MATALSEVYDLFSMKITDYRLDALFATSESDYETYLEAWLIYAINDFTVCDQSLVYDSTTRIFAETLTQTNIVILATLMTKHWLTKVVSDITQMNLHINDRDFKMASESQNLREKSNYLNTVKEECSQLLNDYAYSRVDWTNWFNQSFSGV